jgi:hypothetical protein
VHPDRCFAQIAIGGGVCWARGWRRLEGGRSRGLGKLGGGDSVLESEYIIGRDEMNREGKCLGGHGERTAGVIFSCMCASVDVMVAMECPFAQVW